MGIPSFILAVIGVALALGGLSFFWKKGGDKEASSLDQNTIRAYRDSEVVKDRMIESLKIQLQTKDDIIQGLLRDGHKGRKSGE